MNFVYKDRHEDQPVDPVDTMYPVDNAKLAQWCKHMAKLNGLLMNDLSRDDDQRAIDKGRHETYESFLFMIRNNVIITKDCPMDKSYRPKKGKKK